MEVIRRTFEAAKHPEGSAERARLNECAETSEYRPSYRYMTSGDRKTFRTKALALAHIDNGPWCATCGAPEFKHRTDETFRSHPFIAA